MELISVKETCAEALTTFGVGSQVHKSIEELAELQVALARALNKRGKVSDIIDEIADVSIMLEQLMLIYGHREVQDRIRFKTQRLATRIQEIKDRG